MLQLRKSISLSCLRRPFREALSLAAQMGAQGVEVNARTELKPGELSQTGIRQIRKWLADFNLTVACVQFPTQLGYGNCEGLEERLDGTKAAMRMANDLGCRFVSNRIGSIPRSPDDPQWATMQTALHELAAYSLKAGSWLAIRTSSNSGTELAEFLKQMPQGSLSVDFDPAELMMYRHSTEEAIKVLGSYVGHFRARDAVRDLAGGPTVEVQLGRGTVDFAALLSGLEEHQYRGFITVERNAAANPAQECQQALEYLTNLFT